MPRLYNSTIRTKKEHLKCGCFDYNFSRGRCKQHAILDNIKKVDAKEAEQYEDLSGLVQDADALVSRYVRISAADVNGIVKCFTCISRLPWTHMDAGHYIPRANMFLRHDLRNIKPQCHECNRHMHGRIATYSVNLDLLQPGIVEELIHESRIIHHVTREELRAIISDMTDKLSKLKIKL